MEAKDRITDEQIKEQTGCYLVLGGHRRLADFFFKAGIKEVVEYVTDEIFPLLNMASVSVRFEDTREMAHKMNFAVKLERLSIAKIFDEVCPETEEPKYQCPRCMRQLRDKLLEG